MSIISHERRNLLVGPMIKNAFFTSILSSDLPNSEVSYALAWKAQKWDPGRPYCEINGACHASHVSPLTFLSVVDSPGLCWLSVSDLSEFPLVRRCRLSNSDLSEFELARRSTVSSLAGRDCPCETGKGVNCLVLEGSKENRAPTNP